tara:strand:- start:6048 stop:6416 length:369 start_codon:yes stop_codon:yes gene_type:complete
MTIRNLSHIDKNQVKKIEHSDNKVSNLSTAKAEQAKDALNTDSLALSNVSKDEFEFAKVELSKLNRVTMEQLSNYREMIQEFEEVTDQQIDMLDKKLENNFLVKNMNDPEVWEMIAKQIQLG